MAKKIWQTMTKAGVLAASLGLMSASALANNNCSGGGTNNPSCDTWSGFSQIGSSFGNSVSDTTGGVTVTGTAWSNTGTNGALATAYVGVYPSLGVSNQVEGTNVASPNHAIDNAGNVDSIMFSFGQAVNLSSFNAGWVQTDSDYTVLAYTGTGSCAATNSCTSNVSGKTYTALLSYGWTLIGNYGGTGSSSNNTTGTGAHDFANFNNGSTAANNIFSSYWLIGAYNTMVGGPTMTAGDDYFKLLALSGCTCATNPNAPGCGGGGGGGGVPEPGTLLLMSAGFIGLARINRRRQVAAA
jgi:hypothetical protein